VQDSHEGALFPKERAARKDMLATTAAVLLTQYAEMSNAPESEIGRAVQSAPEMLRPLLGAYHRELVRRRDVKAQHDERMASARALMSSAPAPASSSPASSSPASSSTDPSTPSSADTSTPATPATSSKNGPTDPSEADTQPTQARKPAQQPSTKKGK
jgi:hypothetical protein